MFDLTRKSLTLLIKKTLGSIKKLLKFMHFLIFSVTVAYKQNKIRLADEERERTMRLEIEEASEKTEERKQERKKY